MISKDGLSVHFVLHMGSKWPQRWGGSVEQPQGMSLSAFLFWEHDISTLFFGRDWRIAFLCMFPLLCSEMKFEVLWQSMITSSATGIAFP